MNLLWPIALWGLLTVPLILLLHLLRNRRALIDIPSLRLWRGLERKRQGGLPRHIPLSLMLLLQLIVAVALTLGLARPALSFLLARPQQTIFVLDMTTSMAAADVAGSSRRFDTARQIIQDYLQTMGDQDSFAVISLEPRPQILLSGGSEQKTQARVAVDNLVPGATGVDLFTALTLANGLIDEAEQEHRIIVLTDGNFRQDEPLPVMLAPVTWRLIPDPTGNPANQALLNVSAAPLPDGRQRLFARVVNYSNQPVSRTVRVLTDQGRWAELTVQLEPQAETARVWTLPPQAETAAVEIVEADALPLDNRAELLLTGLVRYRVLLLSDSPDPQNEALARAMAVQPGLELTTDTLAMAQHDPADFDLIVFDGLPSTLTAWPDGNILVVNPPLGHPLLPAQNFERNLRPDLSPEPTEPRDDVSVLLAGVDLSGVYFDRAPQLTLPAWAQVDLLAVSTTGNPELLTPLIFHGNVGSSRLVVWAFDLAASNLPARLALPLLTANTMLLLLAPSPPAVVPVGEPVPLAVNYTIEVPGGRRLSSGPLAENNGGIFTHTKQPGLYRIYDDTGKQIAGFAVQAGSALESNLTKPLSVDNLALTYSSKLTSPSPQIDFEEFWPWLASLALVVVVLEGWLAWRR